MDIAQFPQINPPQRLLMGPGPINADPRVLRAMSSQLIGQYDPAMTHYMNEVMALYRGVFRTENRWTMLVDGTSRAGIEAILVSAIRPGDKVLVPVFGRFGHLLCEIARRCRAEVHTIEVPWGEVFTPDQVEDAIKRVRPRLLLNSVLPAVPTMCCFTPMRPPRWGGMRWRPMPGGWMRSRQACRNASVAHPGRRPSP